MTAVLIISGALILFLLQKWFYTTRWSRDLDSNVCFKDHCVTEGESTVLKETITNRKLLPLITLQVKFSISKYLQFETEENTLLTDQSYRNDIFSIMNYEKIARNLPVNCKKRGYYSINSLDLISNDLFLTKKLVTVVPQNTALYVYPKPTTYNSFDIPFKKLMGTVLTRRYNLEDPFEFRGIRPYETYDSMKNINWKSSAKTGDLKVNQHNYTASQNVTILLNLASDSNWQYDKLFEESIRLAVSYTNACISNGIPVSLVTNGVDVVSNDAIFLPPGAGEGHRTAIIQNLARISSNAPTNNFTSYVKREIENCSSSIYVLISRVQDAELLSTYNNLCLQSPGSQWIAPLHPDMKYRETACPASFSMKWEVPYVS